jgi:hypothetical protein
MSELTARDVLDREFRTAAAEFEDVFDCGLRLEIFARNVFRLAVERILKTATDLELNHFLTTGDSDALLERLRRSLE